MLREVADVRQDDPRLRRRWFQDEFFDLFVWTSTGGEVTAFQLCYDRLRRERVLAWSETGGFIHRRIDDGEHTPVKNMAPIMVADGAFPAARIAAEFERRDAALDRDLRHFIRARIREADSQLPSQQRAARQH